PDPDWTVGTKVGRGPGRAPEHYVLDAVRLRGSPSQVQELFIRTALADGPGVVQVIPQDPGEAGKTVAQQRATLPELQGIAVRIVRPTGDKVTRFQHASSLAEQGLLKVVRGSWNDWWFSDLEAFPDATHDDTADSLSDAVNNCPAPSAFRVRGATA
ncbi:MAG TPA: phage terminase large subunit, partial [Trueperaceae bacterium]